MGKLPILSGIILLTAVLIHSPLNSEDLPPRTLNVRVAVDKHLMSGDLWSPDISRLLRDAFFSFRSRFGIQIKIREIMAWDPDPDADSCFGLLGNLEKKVLPKGCDVVLGIVSSRYDFGGRPGISCCCLNYVLAQYLNSKRNLGFVIQHEICHLFGAIDLAEKDSIMSGREAGYAFDGFTTQIILLNRNRPFYQGSPLFGAEKKDEFISLFRERAALNRREENVHAWLALLCFEKGDYASASEQCANCLAINPESATASTILGQIHLAQGDIDSAIENYRRTLTLRPGFSLPHYNLAVALLEKGQTDEAIAEFQEAIKAKPDYLDAYANLASAYIRQGEVDNSINACRAALGLTADVPEVHYLLALGLVLKWEAVSSSANNAAPGMLEEAISSCQKVISLKPDLPGSHNLLGMAYDYSGRPDLAEAEFLTALKLKPELTTAHLNLALMYFNRKQYEKSAYHLRRILEIDPSSGIGLEIMAAVFEKTKRYDMLK